MKRKPTHDWWLPREEPHPESLPELRRKAIYARAEAGAAQGDKPWGQLTWASKDFLLKDAERHVKGWVELHMESFEHLEPLLRDMRIGVLLRQIIIQETNALERQE